jgi:hypothetical protein
MLVVEPKKMPAENSRIKIIAVPPGEAPLWVREQWVGLNLPISGGPGPQTLTGYGVLSGPPPLSLEQFEAGHRGRLEVTTGYCVRTDVAIGALEAVSAEAAAWWKSAMERPFATPFLMFDKACCEPSA